MSPGWSRRVGVDLPGVRGQGGERYIKPGPLNRLFKIGARKRHREKEPPGTCNLRLETETAARSIG